MVIYSHLNKSQNKNAGGAADTSGEGSTDTNNTGNNATEEKTAVIQKLTQKEKQETGTENLR